MTEFNKIAFVGLDGVPYSLLEKFFQSGVMPNLKKIAVNGMFRRMQSSIPPISSVAWTSFMTGVGPGDHGIFGFTDVTSDEIKLRLPSFDDIRSPVLWNKYPEKRSIIINLPFTYPARPLNGALISGFVSPIFERAVYPQSLVSWLKSKGYRIDTDNVRARQDRGFLIDDLFSTLRPLEEVVFSLVSEPWDIFVFVVTGTDRLNHFLYDAIENPEHPYHHDVISYYQRVDNFVDRFFERLDSMTRIVVLSDHGFTDLKAHVNLNHLLRMWGYLKFDCQDPQDLSSISRQSLAFALDPTRIYLNSRSRFKNGILSESQAIETRARLKNDLSNFCLTTSCASDSVSSDNSDKPLFTEVKLKEEMYQGSCSQFAPDIVVIPRRGYDIKASINAKSLFHKDIFTGTHTHDDAFLIVGDRETDADSGRCEISNVINKIKINNV
ncbi:MAG: alkaline phosphatase family protein [Deltaproteobacteria bacterium]|nr:alkaline phosphatase family protein [Deltaproteobacteria bacterium]